MTPEHSTSAEVGQFETGSWASWVPLTMTAHQAILALRILLGFSEP